MNFDLSSIPNGATITDVQLTVTVSTTTARYINIGITYLSNPSSIACDGSQNTYSAYIPYTTYVTASNWNTTGAKTYDLGATADANVQALLTTTDILPLGFNLATTGTGTPAINSVDSASGKPQLVVSYTALPQTPTNFTAGSHTTTTIPWSWTDNATAETQYDVHSGSSGGIAVTGCSGLAAGSTSCTETGLDPNKQYTRHPNVTDAQGNTDGSSVTTYTSIETPTGVSPGSATTTGMTATATGTISNLTSGLSGLYFQESVTSSNSGWTQTNSWAKSGLTANTQYSFQVKARNGDTDETSLTSAATKYTLSATPSVASTRSISTWYASGAFPFTNSAGWGAGGVQYYRYAWNETATYSFAGTESTWSNLDANCPGGTCTSAGTTLNATATDGNDWYLHVQAFNAENVSNGNGTNYGPYYFDATSPTAPGTVNDGAGADAVYTASTTQLAANWTASTDATSGIQKYQYAIGTTSGGTDTLGWTDAATNSMSNSSLSFTEGTTYYVSAKAVDYAGNVGSVTTSNGILVNTAGPNIENHVTGDAVPRRNAGTPYNVDFVKADTGPQLDYGQYAVYTGPGKTGTLVIDWTDIFRPDGTQYTTDWTVDFSALAEGKNYVSVRSAGEDGIVSELDDAFYIMKDTIAPSISSFVSAPTANEAVVQWTTTEPSTTQLEYGTTTSYGITTTLDSTLTTDHVVSLTGLAESTTFHARALSTDQAGNATASSDLSFVTSAGPHTYITGVTVTPVSQTSVTVAWTTNEPATSKVRYGATTDYGLEADDLTLVTGHSITLTGLTPGTTYHYEVVSVGSTTDHDADATFTTAEEEIPAENTATTLSHIHVLAGEAVATFSWTTNDEATSTVRVGTTSAYGMTATDDSRTKTHKVRMNGLKIGTHYHYVVESVGATTATSEDLTFTTTSPESTTNRAIGPTILSPSFTDGSNPSVFLRGLARGNQTIRFLIDGKTVKTITVGGSSNETVSFTTTLRLGSYSKGNHTLVAQSTDAAGRTSRIRQRMNFSIGSTGTTKFVRLSGAGSTYTVRAGDTLWSIAEHLLGNGARYKELVQANRTTHPNLVTNPNLIRQGLVLRVPA